MVYVDLLVIEDLILNYIILLSTSFLLNRETKLKKIFLSSVIGTIPLVFLFLNLKQLAITIISLLFSIIMSIISFKYKDIIYTTKNIFYMHSVSIFLAGSIYLINTNFLPKINNHQLNTLILLILSPIITTVHLKSINKIKTNYSNYYKIDIYLKDKSKIKVNSYLDTGNQLKDPYTFKPIILVEKELIDITKEKIILVPYKTIDNESLLKCFSPDKIYIDKIGFRKKLLIGIIDKVNIEGANCILNPNLLEK